MKKGWQRQMTDKSFSSQLCLLVFLSFMIISTWHVRGLGSAVKRRIVKSLVYSHKLDFLFIQESKLKVFDSRLISSIGGKWLSRGVGVDAVGASGGLIILWNEEAFVVEDCITNRNCLIISGILQRSQKRLVLCNVYAASVEHERREVWDFILGAMRTLTAPWCVGGDFNSVLDPSE